MASRFNIKVTDTSVTLDYRDDGTYMTYREHAALEDEVVRLRKKRWWQAYRAALTGLVARTDLFGQEHVAGVDRLAREMADRAMCDYE